MAFDIYINKGFFKLYESGVEVVGNPRAETSYKRTSATAFRFMYKESIKGGTPNFYPLAEGYEDFEYADLSTVYEDNVAITKPASADDLALYLDGVIGFFFNPNPVDVEVSNSVEIDQNIDAFGRLRVSELTTQFDAKQLHDNLPLFIDEELIGTATSVHSTSLAQTTLGVNATSDAAILQTKHRFNYQSGKSMLLFWTFNNFGDGANMAVVTARSGTETSRVFRANWDDSLDGTGPSAITHDFDNNTIMMVDYEWLGVGKVRWYIIKNGAMINFHSEDFTGTKSVYMSSPNQPLRWELRQTGASAYRSRIGYFTANTVSPFDSTLDGLYLESTDALDELNTICSSANSEGSINKIGKILSANAGTDDIQLNNSGSKYAAIGIRLKTTHLDSVIDILGFDYLAETNDRALWELWLNPTVGAGTFNYTDVTNGAVQISVGNQTGGTPPTISGGTLLDSGYVGQQESIRESLDSAIKLGSQIDGTRDEIILAITPINSGLDAYVSYSWRELS